MANGAGDPPNGDLSAMRQSRPEARPPVAGMLHGTRELAAALREMGFGPAPPQNFFQRYQGTINAALGVMLAFGLAAAGTAYKASTSQMDQSTQDIRDLRGKVEQIEKDRAARIAMFEARMGEVERSIRRFDLTEDAVLRQGKTVEALNERLTAGREDRIRDINGLTEAQTAIRLELNGVKVELGFIRRALEGREGGERPFDRRQGWSPLWEPPPLLEVIQRPSRDVAQILQGGEPK